MPRKEGQLIHRDRKNGSSREEWQKKKQAANTTRPKQVYDQDTKTYQRKGNFRTQ
jgi:hypothetical protein